MRWPFGLVQVVGQLPQHGCIAIDRTHWLAVDIGQWRQPVISAKNIGGTIDKIEVLLIGHGSGDSIGAGTSLAQIKQAWAGLSIQQELPQSCPPPADYLLPYIASETA
jgi:hypothetical protein